MKNITKILTLLFVLLAVFGPANFVLAQYGYVGYNYHAYQMCNGNNLYWYDSNGSQQDIAQYCTNGCYNNLCQNNYNYNNNYNNYYNYNYNNCSYHAVKVCVGNNLYWYDSCNNQQELAQVCASPNQVCQYGECVINYQKPIIKYIYINKTSKPTTTTTPTNNTTPTNTNNNTTTTGGLVVSFFAKTDATSGQWQKSIQLNPSSQAYFLISVANNTNSTANNISVSVNIPAQVTSLGNLQINGTPVAGDIVAGIGTGTLAPGVTKTITFEGKTQGILTQSTESAVSTVSLNGAMQSDSLSINFVAGQAAASVSSTQTSGVIEFLKRWYLWILVGLVLIFLFVVVFRRLSSST